MKKVASRFAQKSPPEDVATLLPKGVSRELQNIAATFASLQQARHDADYATDALFTRDETLSLIEDARFIFENWQKIRSAEEATIFLAALAFGTRWAR